MAAETRKSRKSNFSQEEIDVLITTVMQNHNILYGETSKSFFHKEIRNQVWNIILEEVNKVSLERRTLNEVKNKWKKCQYNLRAADHAETVDYVDCDDLDSMPLQQRLSQNHNEQPATTPTQEPVLQSQPISPTKLKVTRQGAKPQYPPAKPPSPPPQNLEMCLRWNDHHMNMQTAFPSLLTKEQYVDATLVAEGKTLKCHRVILSSCSPYFEEVLESIGPFQHPVLFMKDTPFWILKALCDFMYAGEVHIYQDKLQELLNVAEALKIKGLVGNSDAKEDVKPVIPHIKQEIDANSPPRIPDKPLKEEKEDEPLPPPKLTKHETARPSKKKEDKKSKHSSQTPREKEREVSEEPPPKVVAKINPKLVLAKVAPKVVPKVVLPKIQQAPKSTIKNVLKNVLQKVAKPSTSKTSRRSDKYKGDGAAQKEKEKEKDKPPLKKDNINDPLDLLEPVYEEIAKEDPHPMMKCINPARLKERGNVPVRKGVNKKVKKRRYEEREESPPPVFSSRKGTRSRPHVKIPKFFHTHYEETQKETVDATIVREPHTDQSDPLIGVEELEEIKAEPLDVEENTIEIEENLENYMQDHEITSQEGEEIIGNYDSPIVNIKREIIKRNTPNIFKKMLDPQPVIMNIHTVTEDSQPGVRLLNINEDTLKIVDISKISTGQNRISTVFTMDSVQEKTSEIMISNVQSMAELGEDSRLKDSQVSKEGGVLSLEREVRPRENEKGSSSSDNIRAEERLTSTGPDPLHPEEPSLRASEETFNTSQNLSESETGNVDSNQIALRIKVEHVRSENFQACEGVQTPTNDTVAGTLIVEEQDAVATTSLGSLEARLSTFSIKNQNLQIEDDSKNLPEGVSCDTRTIRCETDQNLDPEQTSCTDGAALDDCAEPLQQTEVTDSMMPVDSMEGNCLGPGAYNSSYITKEVQSENGQYSVLKNQQKQAGESELGTEREEFISNETREYIDKTPKDAAEKTHVASENNLVEDASYPCRDNYNTEALQFGDETKAVGDKTDDILGSSTEQVTVKPIQNAAAESEEVTSLGTVSQDLMSICADSQEKELEAIDEVPLQRNSEEFPQSEFNNEGTASEALNQDILNSASEVASEKSNEQSLHISNFQVLQINTEEANTRLCEEHSVSHENEVTDNIQNTSEMMSVDSECQYAEEHVSEEALDAQVSEIPAEAKNSETEIVGISISNVCGSSNITEKVREPLLDTAVCAVQLESSGLELPQDVNRTDPTETVAEKNIKELPDNIEAELEECLASTSNIAPKKLPEEKLTSRTERLSFEEDEDFTKDIEFDNFIGRNRPANYLEDDFENDFEMKDTEEFKSRDGSGEGEAENDRIKHSAADSDKIDIKEEKETESEVRETVGDKGMVNDARPIEGEIKDGDFSKVVKTDDTLKGNQNISSDVQEGDPDSKEITNLNQDPKEEGHIVNLKKNMPATDERLDIHQNLPEEAENFNEHLETTEEEQKLEDRLLADLDDDVEMREASSDDEVEQTLEMIVNDLNEKLGELKK